MNFGKIFQFFEKIPNSSFKENEYHNLMEGLSPSNELQNINLSSDSNNSGNSSPITIFGFFQSPINSPNSDNKISDSRDEEIPKDLSSLACEKNSTTNKKTQFFNLINNQNNQNISNDARDTETKNTTLLSKKTERKNNGIDEYNFQSQRNSNHEKKNTDLNRKEGTQQCNNSEKNKENMPFNYLNYINHQEEFNYKNNEVHFYSIPNIIIENENDLNALWKVKQNSEPTIFKDSKDFDCHRNAKIIIEAIQYLSQNDNQNINNEKKYYFEIENEKVEKLSRIDNNSTKIKNNLIDSITKDTNDKLKESTQFSKYKIISIDYQLINSQVKADFNLAFLEQPIYKILSNGDENKKIINILMKDDNFAKFLKQTVKDYLDIFRYRKKEQNEHESKYRLVDFLKNEYKNQKKKELVKR